VHRGLGAARQGGEGRVALHDGRKVVSARMYTGWRSLWEGVTKNLVDMLGGPRGRVTWKGRNYP
jgi:hypothetical protein